LGSDHIRRLFFWLSEVLLLECFEVYFDKRLALWPDDTYYYWRIIVSSVGYVLRPLMLYIVLLIMSRNARNKTKTFLYSIPTLITLLTTIFAFFTKWVFWYDEVNQFHGGPLRYIFFFSLIAYFIMIIFQVVGSIKKHNNESFVILGVVSLLIFDMVWSINHQNISIHLELEALCVLIYFMYFLAVFHAKEIEKKDEEIVDSEQRLMKTMLDESIETLAYTIDAKDKYTKGHSFRVAKYSRMIAGLEGRSEDECRKIYIAGLLHDIGKISISGAIINKQGKLTDEEYEKMKTHPDKGALILEKMKSIPYIQNGAKYHHERYDGKGYPSGLKGDEIPDMARIIAVADAYDAMTSYRSYRSTMERNLVKQEIWKGMGTQFDPLYAKIMIALIDADPHYKMREFPDKQDEIIFDDYIKTIVWPSAETKELEGAKEDKTMLTEGLHTLASFIKIDDDWFDPKGGYDISADLSTIRFIGTTLQEAPYVWCAPVIIVYTSDDGEVLGRNYEELAVYMCAGYGWKTGPALREYSDFVREEKFDSWDNWVRCNKEGLEYTVSAHIEGNEVILLIENGLLTMKANVLVPDDYKKKIRIALSGFQCEICTKVQ